MTTYNTSHYTALMTRLSNEKGYLAVATKQSEIEPRIVWIKQIEKEIECEVAFLITKGINVYHPTDADTVSDDDLLSELFD